MRSVAFRFEIYTKYRTCKRTLYTSIRDRLEREREREKEGGRERERETQVMQSWVKESIYPPCGSSRSPGGWNWNTQIPRQLHPPSGRPSPSPPRSLASTFGPPSSASFIIFQLSLFGDLSPIINIIPVRCHNRVTRFWREKEKRQDSGVKKIIIIIWTNAVQGKWGQFWKIFIEYTENVRVLKCEKIMEQYKNHLLKHRIVTRWGILAKL